MNKLCLVNSWLQLLTLRVWRNKAQYQGRLWKVFINKVQENFYCYHFIFLPSVSSPDWRIFVLSSAIVGLSFDGGNTWTEMWALHGFNIFTAVVQGLHQRGLRTLGQWKRWQEGFGMQNGPRWYQPNFYFVTNWRGNLSLRGWCWQQYQSQTQALNLHPCTQ